MPSITAAVFSRLKIGRFRDPARDRQNAFEAQVEPCWDALWRYALRLTGNRADAEDLLSETLLDGFRDFAQFRGETTFQRWMYRVMATNFIDQTRRARRHRAESLEEFRADDAQRATLEVPDSRHDPARLLLDATLSEPLQQALDSLSEEFRIVLVLAEMEGLDYAEVSQILHIPVGTVRSRLHRARAAVKNRLGPLLEKEHHVDL